MKHIAAEINRETLTGARDYALFMLMVSCGLRTIEVSLANIEDLSPIGDKTVLYVQGKGHGAVDFCLGSLQGGRGHSRLFEETCFLRG